MKQFKIAALWTFGKFLAVFVFAATSMVSCGTVFYGASAVFYPEQTDFPNAVPPTSFMVVTEDRGATKSDEKFRVIRWARLAEIKAPHSLRLSTKEFSSQSRDPWGFRVTEETSDYQVIELWHSNTQSIRTRYRAEATRVTPLSYKNDGGVGLVMILMPAFVLFLWIGLVAARRSTRWVNPAIAAMRSGADAPQS